MVLFEDAADEYDAFRPAYPPALYDLLDSVVGGLAGLKILDAGAGTGVATRELVERGATLTALDAGMEMLSRAKARSPELRYLVADAAVLPLRSASFHLICFAQSWHWMSQAKAASEAARALRPGGWWAAWWNHPWADGEAWFDDHQALLEQSCPGYSREQREVDWTKEAVAREGAFSPPERHVVRWERIVSVEAWVRDLSSHSYVLGLAPPERREVLRNSEALARDGFPGGKMAIAYQTRLWVSERR